MGIRLTAEERFEAFGDFDPDTHTAEVEERWGDSDAFRESQRRTARYTKGDWLRMKEESAAPIDALLATMRAGLPADSDEAMDAAEQHRQHISRWFYECTTEIHVGLGEMYVADPRFAATYEKIAPGLATYLRDAIRANAAREG